MCRLKKTTSLCKGVANFPELITDDKCIKAVGDLCTLFFTSNTVSTRWALEKDLSLCLLIELCLFMSC